MNVVVNKSKIFGSVCVPPSKSVAHRLMIAAMLAGDKLDVKDGGKDMCATAQCLEVIRNAMCSKTEKNQNAHGKMELPILNAGESGSTLRFLLPIVCALGLECVITGEGRLKDRPLGELVETLTANGAVIEIIERAQLPLRTGGKLRAGKYEIDGGISSQYVTGLLFALPLLDDDSEIVLRGELVSSNYVDITLGVLTDFGIEVRKTNSGYYVKGNQRYVVPQNISVESDWSSAAFMLALGVLSGEVRIQGLNGNSLQGDKVVVDLLRSAGADIIIGGNEIACCEVIAKKSALHAIDFDAKHCPDIVPIMAAVLSFAKGESHISSVDRLRDKESDRLSAVRTLLSDFGIRTEYANDVLTVFGGEHKPCHTHGFSDHRMAMSAIVMALNTDGKSQVDGVECIAKSYPTFVEHAIKLGADIKKLESK